MSALRCTGLVLWPLLPVTAVIADCPLEADNSRRDGDYTYSVTTVPAAVRVGEHFSLAVRVCEKDRPLSADIAVDAVMPAHGHGMNYAPSVVRTGEGEFLAHGMLLHMPGHWQFVIDLGAAGKAPLRYDFAL